MPNNKQYTLKDVKEAHIENPEQKQDFICATEDMDEWRKAFASEGFTLIDHRGLFQVYLDDSYVGDFHSSSFTGITTRELFRIPRKEAIWDRDSIVVETPKLDKPVFFNDWWKYRFK